MAENELDGGMDFNTLLEWIETGDRDLQLSAIEHLCMTILMSDNVDRCFENCPPRQFMPALCRIFLDESTPIHVLEAAARAMTYYMEVSNECSRRITAVEGTVKAICDRIGMMTGDQGTGRELVEQCVKVLEHICQRETTLVYEAGGFSQVLSLARDFSDVIHKDTLRSAMTVITRLCSKIEPSDAVKADYSVTLGKLLMHNDLAVSESALRSIAAIVDRFLRKYMDPCEFASRCGLVDLLLGIIVEPSGESTSAEDAIMVLSGKPISFISIVLSLLSNLCRGSATATDLVVRSNKLMPVLKAVMTSRDERCVMDGLRLTGMILSLICEGRQSIGCTQSRQLTEVALSSKFTQKHKQVIESIRNKDYSAFTKAINSAAIDVNYTDDVGQALLNWVAAFGTVEMARFLLDKGANVDGGNRSSSLHYAAIFGRPEIARMLLENGANPELRDEEGKTPLEKARERHEEGNKQVARLLESPQTKHVTATERSTVDSELFNSILSQLVPIFCTVNKTAFSVGIRRSSLNLMRKCIISLPAQILRNAIDQDNLTNEFAEHFLGMFENALDRDDDTEVREQVLLMIQSLLDRDTEFWREQITRIGVHEKVELLANEVVLDDDDEDSSTADPASSTERSVTPPPRGESLSSTSSAPTSSSRIDSVEEGYGARMAMFKGRPPASIFQGGSVSPAQVIAADSSFSSRKSAQPDMDARAGRSFKWKEWRIIHHTGTTYVWCDAVCIKLNEDGTASYFMENKIGQSLLFLTTQRPEDNELARLDFMELFVTAKNAVATLPVTAIFEASTDNWLGFCAWDFLCQDGKKLEITYNGVEGSKLEIHHDVPGFSFNLDADTVETVIADNMLHAEFKTGWTQTASPKKDLRKVARRERMKQLATELWNKYLKHCKNNMRGELKALQHNAEAIIALFKEVTQEGVIRVDRAETERRFYNNLEQVRDALLNDNSLSVFEIAHSGIVHTLCFILAHCVQETKGPVAKIFSRVFCGEELMNTIVRKIVLVFEALEKFPMYRYDRPSGSVTGMRLLTRRFRLQLEQADPKHWLQQKLLNNTGRQMKVDPLCSVTHLRHYFLQMMSKFWFDTERPHLYFVQKVRDCKLNSKELVFTYESNFDTNGIIYFIGTNGYKEEKWTNPISCGLVRAASSDGKYLPYDSIDEIFSRDSQAFNCHTSDVQGSYFVFDLGVSVFPSAYSLRHSEGYNHSALRKWTLEGSEDNQRWYVVARHADDEALNNAGDSATWQVNANVDVPFRFFRIVQKGFNSSGKTYYLSVSGFEIYGNVVNVTPETLPALNVPRLGSRNNARTSASSTNSQFSWTYRPNRATSNEENPFTHHRAVGRSNLTSYGDTLVDVVGMRDRSANADGSHKLERQKAEKHKVRSVKPENEFPPLAGPFDNSEAPVLLDAAPAPSSAPKKSTERVFDASAASYPQVIDAINRPKIDIKVESDFPSIQKGYNVQSIAVDKKPGQFGRAITAEDNGKVCVMWDSGEVQNVRYGKHGVHDVVVLANQAPKSATQAEKTTTETHPPTSTALAASISQKSMSTTNLFDERKSRRSVASTNQAASAESLQHQTPSLENLLSRARFVNERIPETGEFSPSYSPEPANNEQNLNVSVAASTFGGGSHPVLSHIRRSVDSEVSFNHSRGSVNSSTSGRAPQMDQENESGSSSTGRIRNRWAPDASSQELFNEEDEAELQLQDDDNELKDVSEDPDEEIEPTGDGYYTYQVMPPEEREGSSTAFHLHDEPSGTQASHSFNENELYSNVLDAYSNAFGGESDDMASSGSGFMNMVERVVSGGNSNSTTPSRFRNYEDALRSVMQQVLEGNSGDSEEIEDDLLFNDDYEEDGTDDIEEDLLNQGLAQVVTTEDSQHAILSAESEEDHGGVQTGRTSGTNAARMAFRQFMGFPQRFYDILNPVSGGGDSASARSYADRLNHGSRANRRRLRHWDDDFTLKPAYFALIPVFDPRPGRNNVNQIQDVDLPEPTVDDKILFKRDVGLRTSQSFTIAKTEVEPKDLRLYLRGPNLPGIKNATVELLDNEHKILFYVHRLLNLTDWDVHAGKRASSKIWEPTYTIIYEVAGCSPSSVEVTSLCSPKLFTGDQLDVSVHMALDAVVLLKRFLKQSHIDLDPDVMISEKLSQKIMQELNDPLLISANSLPEWCKYMLTKNKHLFALETRRNYLMATAFGTARSIVWAQTVLDQAASERSSTNPARREDSNDFRIGRLKHERIRVPRTEDFFETAIRVFKFHAVRKSVLEIQYINEEGTGLGPTLEFYALVAAEFQRKARAMWICDDEEHILAKNGEVETDLGNGKKPPGYYVRRPGGLFPAPIPPNTDESEEVCRLFRVLGIFLGKVVQDGRLVDIPLSLPLLRLLYMNPDSPTIKGLLKFDAFEVVYPEKAHFIDELNTLRAKRDIIWNDKTLSREQRLHIIRNLRLNFAHTTCALEELGLTFVVDPSSNIFKYRSYELIENGSNIDVTLGNLNEYVDKFLDFHLNTGIRPQINAFREGFSLVCPLQALSIFTASELLTVLCGDQTPQWTTEELVKYTVPKNGYTRESTTFKRFVQVLTEMDANQRKCFLQFATGCSSLPPGGLANLHPPLTIVRKTESGDGAYPSVNTCVHYLKMPDYSSLELLRERLLCATLQKGFYLN